MNLNELLGNLLYATLTVAVPYILYQLIPYLKESLKNRKLLNEENILANALDNVMDAVLYVNQIYVDSLKKEGKFTEQAQNDAFKLAYNEAIKVISNEAKEIIEKSNESLEQWLYKQIEIAVNSAKK